MGRFALRPRLNATDSLTWFNVNHMFLGKMSIVAAPKHSFPLSIVKPKWPNFRILIQNDDLSYIIRIDRKELLHSFYAAANSQISQSPISQPEIKLWIALVPCWANEL